jgi:hypothetical protein
LLSCRMRSSDSIISSQSRSLHEPITLKAFCVVLSGLMEIVSVWGVNKDLEFVNMPGGRRILVNTMTWIEQ